jgi:hypothetical protein
MKFDLAAHYRKTLRKRLTEYRNFKLESGTEASIHINSIEIALNLVEFALKTDRPIKPDEEMWFIAGFEVNYLLESSEWEDIIGLYGELAEQTRKKHFYRP